MSTDDLVEGEKYLIGLPPWGLMTVRYLGPALCPGYSRVQNPLTRKVCWVRTEKLRPHLVAV